MLVHVIGYKGNMGRRYTSILDYLKVKWIGTDPVDLLNIDGRDYRRVTHTIVATPTETHIEAIESILNRQTYVLVEKPFAKTFDEVEDFVSRYEDNHLSMINQYKFIKKGTKRDPYETTYYDYYNSGKDGLLMDCISLIALAKSKVHLCSASPIWKCVLNGSELSLSHMDAAYIKMIQKWLAKPEMLGGPGYILEAHKKVEEQRMRVWEEIGLSSAYKREVAQDDYQTKSQRR